MEMLKTDLSLYDNSWYHPGAGSFKRTLWHFTNALIFNSSFFPVNGLKVFLLKLFGARIGKGVIIKPSVNIKYPWLLQIGEYTWIGENVWIDNLTDVKIGSNCCLSQGAMLLTGNHNFKSRTFDLIVKPIVLEDGVWIGARSLVAPGVTCYSHSVLAAFSFTSKDLDAFYIYKGNPAVKEKIREIGS